MSTYHIYVSTYYYICRLFCIYCRQALLLSMSRPCFDVLCTCTLQGKATVANDGAPADNANPEEPAEPTRRVFQPGAPISIQSSDEVLAHGCVIDGEPDASVLFDDQDLVHEEVRLPSLWLIVKLVTVVRGAGDDILMEDHVFFSDGCAMNDQERKVKYLARDQKENGFLIWHEWVVPRVRAAKKAQKRRKKK